MLMLVWVICCSPFCFSVISEKAEATHRQLASFYRLSFRAASACISFSSYWLYSTLLPEPWACELNRGWRRAPGISPLRGSLRAAPIAWSPKKKRGLWLSRCTIVGGQGHRKTACQCCFWSGWSRSSPYLPSFMEQAAPQVVFAHPTASLFHISGLPAEVIQSPDIHFSRCNEWSK